MFPKIGVPQNGWIILENPIEMDDLGYPYFWKHPHLLVSRLAASFGLVAYFKPWRSLLSTQVDMITHVTRISFREKLGTLQIGDVYQHIPPIYGLYNGYIVTHRG